jgi:hypothetical protein
MLCNRSKFTFCACAEKELPAGFPQILQNPGMKVVEKGRNAVLVCEATGEPAPAIAWVRDTVPIDLEVSLIVLIFELHCYQMAELAKNA